MPAIAILIMAGAVALASPAPDTAAVAGLGPVVSGDALQMQSGNVGLDPGILVEVDNAGTVTGNVAHDNVTGQNVVGGGAFGNAAGISTVIQNSGNNVLIQNGTAVNVQFGGPAP
ncbi:MULTISPECIES: carbon storage regulator [unclassified Luteimonas]|uniref:carbon storage regulator n=1 Tax=unclassified Luteimonas TaxID=2629088 RepID=UPI001601BE10|nr:MULTISPECIES: carbon storage regulator [unclassified Luteimonas]MBB1472411.1 carbon storage regulator [Luteimonas sp. MC1782]MBB6598877.1 carbon storage regulator [Luteimonas sp. MC1825]QOC89634.1 carbon storage regulator [Luteimonas sp. MC1825]